MLFGKKKTQKTLTNVASAFNQNNRKNNGREISDKRKRTEDNKEDDRDWIDELAMLDEIFDD